jgi:hypothetical protein
MYQIMESNKHSGFIYSVLSKKHTVELFAQRCGAFPLIIRSKEGEE